jgi:protein transport protein SEC24
MSNLYVFPPEICAVNVHPRFWSLHTMEPQMGQVDSVTQKTNFPPLLNLSSEKLERHGLFLLENAMDIFIFMGRAVSPELCQLIFNQPNYDSVIPGKVCLAFQE